MTSKFSVKKFPLLDNIINLLLQTILDATENVVKKS